MGATRITQRTKETGAIATRENQKEERAELNSVIDDAMNVIAELNVQKLALSKEQIELFHCHSFLNINLVKLRFVLRVNKETNKVQGDKIFLNNLPKHQ